MTSYFKKISSVQFNFIANSSILVRWNATFQTASVGTGYNFTANYHPGWGNVKLYRNGTDVTGSVSTGGGTIAVPAAIAAGNNTWEVRATSPNRVLSFGFDKGIYYRGQTFTTSRSIDMANLQTELVTYYDPSGVQLGATIGDNFPLGVYTAVYWCENGTDAGYAMGTVIVTDNGSIGVHLSDAAGRDLSGVLVNITSINRTGYTNLLGRVSFTDIEFGNYTVAFTYPTRGAIGSAPVNVNADGIQVDYQTPSRFVFEQVPVTVSLVDKFGDGFAGKVTLSNMTGVITTQSVSGTAGSGGFFTTVLDEGNYSITVEYPVGNTITMNASTISVVKDVSTSFSLSAPGFDAHVSWHAGSINTTMHDWLGRPIPGIDVEVEIAPGTWIGGTSDASGAALFGNVYWGNKTAFNVTWWDGAVMVGTTNVTLDTTGTVQAPLVLPYQWTFTVSLTIQAIDSFSNGFPGTITVRNVTSGTVVSSSIASAAGFATFLLPETNGGSAGYNITVEYPSVVYTSLFGVLKGNGTWIVNAPIDAYPSLHSTTVVTTIRDALSRWIDGINVTLVGTGWNGTGMTGVDGKVTFYNVYWGYSTSFTVTWRSPTGAILNSSSVIISSTTTKTLPTVLPFQYIYTGLTVSFSTIDKFGSGFPATIRHDNGTAIATTGSNGFGTATMNEGTYTIEALFNAAVVNSTTIVVMKATGQSFMMHASSLDSSPGSHVATLVAHIQDSIGRNIFGVTCRVTGVDGTWQSVTDSSGNATITGCYWGNSSSFSITWSDAQGAIDAVAIAMPEARIYYTSRSMASPYVFKNLPVSFNVTDKNAVPYPATLTIYKLGVNVETGGANAFGYYQTTLDEGDYTVKVEYPSGNFVANRSITVSLSNHTTTFNVTTTINSLVLLSVVRVNFKDALGRNVFPVLVRMSGNVTKESITDGAGNVVFTNVPYQDDPSYTITFYRDSTGTVIDGALPVTIDDDEKSYNYTSASQYFFTDIVTTFTIVDAFGVGFRANLTILDSTNVTVISTSITTESGQRVLDLDEGNYTAVIRFGGTVIQNKSITVLKDTSNAHSITTSIDAYPETHTSPVTVTVSDALGRFVPGLVVNLTSNETSYQVITGSDGIASFLGVYWGFDQWFNVTVIDGMAILNETVSFINATSSVPVVLPSQYIFKHVPVTIEVLDKNGVGYAANVTIRNATIALNRQATTNGLLSVYLDEGNYTVEIWYNGSIVLAETLVVRSDLETTFMYSTPIDAHPVVKVIPDWLWWIIVPGGIIIAFAAMLVYKRGHERMEKLRRTWAGKKRYIENLAGTRLVMAYTENGIELAAKAYHTDLKEKSTLASGLFNAVEAFGKELDAESKSVKAFHYDRFSGHIFKGKFITIAVLCTTELGGIYSDKVTKFIQAYEYKHATHLKEFKGNVVPFEEDFAKMYGEFVGTELLEPCYWQIKEIYQMSINMMVKDAINTLINKRHVKFPTIADVMDFFMTRDEDPHDTVYDGLFAIYTEGFVYPERLSSAKAFISSMFGDMDQVSPDELKEFQDAKRVAAMEVGKLLDATDKAIEDGQMMVNEKLLTSEQYEVLVREKKGEREMLSSKLSAIDTITYRQWIDTGKDINAAIARPADQ